jgi:hypothetical protein
MKYKTCEKCNTTKPIEDFYEYKRKKLKDGSTSFYRTCKLCVNAKNKAWHHANKERFKELQRNNWLRNQFGITTEEFNVLLEQQNGGCAICGQTYGSARYRNLAVDHDHNTGKVRGLLCFNCNTGLGAFKDSTDRMQTAVSYIQRFEAMS